MPTYDYECKICGYLFEAFHSMFSKPLIDCPKCGQPKLIKLIGMGAAAIVKGSDTPCRDSKKSKDRLGEGKYKTKELPPWRDGPINKNILKNPEKYIKTGEE